jgi:hypothetical protein
MTTHAPPRADGNSRISVHAPPRLVNSITEYSELYFEKLAPYLDSSEDDLLFFVRLALIRRSMHCHAPPRAIKLRCLFSTRQHTPSHSGHVAGTSFLPLVAPRIRHVSLKSPVSLPRQQSPCHHATWHT